MEREPYEARAVRSARRLGDFLLATDANADPDETVREAVSLIVDCVRYLELPDLAVALVRHLHPYAERWSTWAPWTTALEALAAHATLARADCGAVLSWLSQATRELGDYERAEAAARSALELARAGDDPTALVAALNKLGLVAYRRDRLAEARAYLVEAAALIDRAVPSIEHGHTFLDLGIVALLQNQRAVARGWLREAVKVYKAVGDDVHAAKAACCLVEVQRRDGVLRTVPRSLYRAIETFRRAGARFEYAQGLNDLGCLLMTLGRYDEAHTALEESVSACELIGAEQARASIMSNLAELYVTIGDYERAEPTLRATRELAELHGLVVLAAVVDVDWGRLYWKQGLRAEARELWQRAYEIQSAAGATGHAAVARGFLDLPPDAPV